MKNADKKNLLTWNTVLWLVAMVLPACFSLAFAATKFPWQIIVPLLLIGPMLASNLIVTKAIRGSTAQN